MPGEDGQLEITFVGTATVLIRHAGGALLTDPNFLHRGEHAYLGYGLQSRRLTEPALQIHDLPPLDLVVLSHHHGDHFDRRAAAGLPRDLTIVTEPHAARTLRSQGFTSPVPLTTWQAWSTPALGGTLTVTATPARHAPPPVERLLPPVMGSILELDVPGRGSVRLYVTGDTLLFPGLAEVGRRFPDVDLCLIHLGGTRIAGLLLTMDDRQGVEALRTVAPRRAIPIHYDDYTVFRSPLDAFRRRADAAGLATELTYLARGETYRLPLSPSPTA